MIFLFNHSISPGSIHVLIVGVGSHENRALDPIVGMDQAMRRNCEWWINEGSQRCLSGWELGTVEALVSSEFLGQFTAQNSLGIEVELKVPTVENVRRALLAWLERVRTGGFGILHWAGHGAIGGLDHGGPIQVLYCQDSSDRQPHGIDWYQTLRSVRSLSGGARVCCMIDTCRSRPKITNWQYATIGENFEVSPRRHNPMIIYSVQEEMNAYAYGKKIEKADFLGGPLGSHAILDAFDRFAAGGSRQRAGHAMEYAVTPSSILEAMQIRMKRIGSRIEGLGPDWNPVPTPETWSWGGSEPIMKAPTPHCMLDVRLPPGQDLAQTDCSLIPTNGGESPRCQISPAGVFEFSPSYGDYKVRVGDSPPSKVSLSRVWVPYDAGEAQ